VTTSPTPAAHGPAGLIRRLPTGVPGLDAVLGGGLPEFSFNLIAGGPGAGKTTLAQQILFANATPERPGLYFTVLGEPTLKMMRYQRQFAFFDAVRVGRDVHLVNLSGEATAGELDAVLARIVAEVERLAPGIVVVDSFRTLGPQGPGANPAALAGLEHFVQRLALQLTTWETTSFLISEYENDDQRHPVFTVADGIVWLSQVADRNSVVRKLQVMKVRGQAFMPGLHTFRIGDSGLDVFPRIPQQQANRRPPSPERLSTGVPGLDEMMGGGIPAGDVVMLAGPAGTGKTTFAGQFVAAGARVGERSVITVFEEYPESYIARARTLGVDLAAMVEEGMVRVIYLRPLDLSVDETLAEILAAVAEIGATRVVIDSISGFEIALAPAFREDFRESFYRLVGALTAVGATVMLTNEVVSAGLGSDLSFTGERVSFLTDDIIVQRYVEIEGQLRTVLAVIKMRGSTHSRDFREYTVTPRGAVVGESMQRYFGILTGFPEQREAAGTTGRPGLAGSEAAVLDALVRLGVASLAALETRTATPRGEVARAIDRLVALGYAVPAGVGDEGPAYRAVARVSGA
jgi:circadian clock protein KaiC